MEPNLIGASVETRQEFLRILTNGRSPRKKIEEIIATLGLSGMVGMGLLSKHK